MKKFTVKINTQNEQHTKISVFNRGGYSGQLTVLTEDVTELIGRITSTTEQMDKAMEMFVHHTTRELQDE